MSYLDLGHSYYLDNESSPSGEVLSPLPGTSLRIVLLPSEIRIAPVGVHCIDNILTQLSIHLAGLALKGTWNVREDLWRLC